MIALPKARGGRCEHTSWPLMVTRGCLLCTSASGIAQSIPEGAVHDLDGADVPDVEVGEALGEDGKDSFGEHAAEEVFSTGLLGSNDGADRLFEVGLRADIFNFIGDEV